MCGTLPSVDLLLFNSTDTSVSTAVTSSGVRFHYSLILVCSPLVELFCSKIVFHMIVHILSVVYSLWLHISG
jgi:hypothetical protein